MNKIEQFRITGMTISGFKSYEGPTELTFGDPTVITGGNGRGKTSIADAIAFAVTGLPFFGERGIDRLHNENNPDVSIQMRFVDERGAAHELTRTRRKNRMTISYDGYEIRQLDLTDLFGERDVFLSILNPLYFIEELGEDGKNLLERYLPHIPQETILAQLSESVRETLKDEFLLSPDAYLKRRREEIRGLEERITYLNGQKDMAVSQSEKRDKAWQELTDQQKALKEEAAALEAKQFADLDVERMQERLVELSRRYDETAQDTRGEAAEQQKELHALREKLVRRQAEQYQSKYTKPLAELSAKVRELGAHYQRESAIYKAFHAGMECPTCHRSVTEQTLPEVQAAIKKTLSELYAAGTEQRNQLTELQELDRKAMETFEQFKGEDLRRWEAEISVLEQSCAERSRSGAAESSLIRTEIQSLTTEEMSDLGGEIRQAQDRIGEIKRIMTNVIAYISKRAELTFSQLRMNKVEISLYDVVKSTGEVKDTFKFTYGGRRYDRLSLSEKIRAGMEVSELMKRLTGRNYPTFVDNMESVDDLANVRPTGQVIMAKCVSNAPLQVRPIKPVVCVEQQAA